MLPYMLHPTADDSLYLVADHYPCTFSRLDHAIILFMSKLPRLGSRRVIILGSNCGLGAEDGVSKALLGARHHSKVRLEGILDSHHAYETSFLSFWIFEHAHHPSKTTRKYLPDPPGQSRLT